MAHKTTNYEKLYSNMKESLTVESGDCSLGEYMLMKAADKKREAALPVAIRPSATRSERTVALICNYVEDKLTVKSEPEGDTVIRSFPLRTSASALLAAFVVCTFLISFALIGSKVMTPASRLDTINITETEVTETAETANTATVSE